MISYKTKEEIEKLRVANQLVGKAHGEVSKIIKPGITSLAIDKVVEEVIRDNGGEPAFLGYGGFPNSACISINDAVVHGIPTADELKEGDIISVDIGSVVDGYYGDSAYTYAVGEISEADQKLLDATKESLYRGIEAAKIGNRIGDIGFAVQNYIEKENGMHCVRDLVGHGVGTSLHEDPEVPNYGRRGNGLKLQEGLVIAIEPMVNIGTRSVVQESDGWTIRTRDKSNSAHFEHTIAITKDGPDILSTFEFIKD